MLIDFLRPASTASWLPSLHLGPWTRLLLWTLAGPILLYLALCTITQIANIHFMLKCRRLGHVPPMGPNPFSPGNLPRFRRGIRAYKEQKRMEMLMERLRDFGNPNNPNTVLGPLLFRWTIITTDPDNIKALLTTQFNDFGKGEKFNHEFHDFLGDSIFTTDGDLWHNSRNLLRPQFIKDRVSDLETFETHLQILLKILKGSKGQTIDISELFFAYTLDAATEFLLGRSSDSLEHTAKGGQDEFAEAFKDVQKKQLLKMMLGPLQAIFPVKGYTEALLKVEEFIQPFIDLAASLPQEDLERKDGGYTFLHALAKQTKDAKFLRDQIMATLLAGRDTTACTLSWLFYEFSTNPEVVRKLRAEIEAQVGFERAPTYADLKSMRYLQVRILPSPNILLPSNKCVVLPQRDLAHLSCRPRKRPRRPTRHNAPPWRWLFGQRTHRHPCRH
jgi:cytochrome P450